MPQRDRSLLLRDLKAAFPQITSELNSEQGQLHFEVEVFRRLAQRAIFDCDRDLAAQCFHLPPRTSPKETQPCAPFISTARPQ